MWRMIRSRITGEARRLDGLLADLRQYTWRHGPRARLIPVAGYYGLYSVEGPEPTIEGLAAWLVDPACDTYLRRTLLRSYEQELRVLLVRRTGGPT